MRTIGNRLRAFNAIQPVLLLLVVFVTVVALGAGEIDAGDFLAFNAAMLQFALATTLVTNSLAMVVDVIPILDRARPILEAATEISSDRADPGDLSGQIEVKSVSFRYSEDTPLVLRNLSIKVEPGEFVALVGPSGSGKSSLLRVLLGFEQPEIGSVYYDGQDLATLDTRAVRRQLGVVLQAGRLMPGELYKNIIGTSTLTVDDAWAAAARVGLAEDIQRMPMGMYTYISEGVSTLSGGQRQRLMIARAIVNQPRIIFLDEATSALDNEAQAVVTDTLKRLDATVVAIAHRLSTIRQADRIFVIEAGRLVQAGTYDELIDQPGVFADLARRQLS